MPMMLGTELVRKIKAVTPKTLCIIMTGSETNVDQLLAMDEVSGVLQKPCALADLRRSINEAGEEHVYTPQARRITG